MGRWVLVIGGVAAAALMIAAGVFVIRHDWAVEDLMEELHDGADSSWGIVRRQAGAESPDWDAVRQPASGFVEMARVLGAAKHADIRASADGYATAATQLMDSVERHDAEAFRESVRGLERSCGDCHFDGGVGGRLAVAD